MKTMNAIFLGSLLAAAFIDAEAQTKRKPDNVGGKEITSTAELYAAVPGNPKRSELVGGMVKTYSGEIDLICAQASKICVITFKDKK